MDGSKDNEVIDSIDVLRHMFNLSTPIRTALSGGVVDDVTKPRQPNFSPNIATKKSSEKSVATSSKKKYCETPKLVGELLSHTSDSAEVVVSTRTEKPEASKAEVRMMQTKIQALEASQIELKSKLQDEHARRSTLEASYEKLSEFRGQQSKQLERVLESRDLCREESTSLKRKLEAERLEHDNIVCSLKRKIELQRLAESEKLRNDVKKLHMTLNKTEARRRESESIVKSLTKEVEKLNYDLKAAAAGFESKMNGVESQYKKKLASLQNDVFRLESELSEKQKKAREAEAFHEELKKAQYSITEMKQNFSLEKKSIEAKNFELQKSLQIIEAQVQESNHFRTESKKKVPVTNPTNYDASENNNVNVLFAAMDDLKTEKRKIKKQLLHALQDRKDFRQNLQQTQMELEGLKENLDEAERIERRNEELEGQAQLMTEKLARVDDLQKKLNISELSNLKALIEVATQRETVRELIGDLEELIQESLKDHPQQVRPRESINYKETPRKRQRYPDSCDDSDECNNIVL